ncbi:MAG: glycosyltransferase family 4 protein [Woeseiaceae bacterium]
MARITLVSRNFPPLTGGMERLVHQLYLNLLERHEVTLLGPAGCEDFVSAGANVRASRISPTSVFLLLTLLKGIFGRKPARPDVVIGGSGLVGPVVLALAGMSRAKSILLVHGLDIVADSRLYQWLFVPLLKRADVIVCNSKNTAALAQSAGVDVSRIVTINPGVDVEDAAVAHEEAKRSLGLEDKTILLSVGRLIPRKGLAEFIERSFADLVKTNPDMVLLIAGSEPSSALNRPDTSVLARIKTAIAAHKLEHHVQLLGHVAGDGIAPLYAAADAFVFPLVETRGDVEGFGMVAIEAAAQGAPTVAFDCGGVSDAVANGTSGYLVAAENYAEFSSAIVRAVSGELRGSAREFANQFSWENYAAKTEACLQEMLA